MSFLSLAQNALIASVGGFRPILRGFAPGVQDDDVVTFGQMNNQSIESSTSNLFIQSTALPAGVDVTVPTHYNAIAYGEYTVEGELTVDGEFRVVDWPS